MHSYYFVPLLAILLQGGSTLVINSDLSTFAKLCFLPDSSMIVELPTLIAGYDKAADPFHAVIGNRVMQEKMSQFLTDKSEILPSEDLDKLCMKGNIESVDEHGGLTGKVWGFENLNGTYNCQASKDFPGIQRCRISSASKKFDEATLTFYHMAKEDELMEINCFKSGQVGWALYSQNPSKITEEEKTSYFARANALGFPEKTNSVMYGKHCAVKT